MKAARFSEMSVDLLQITLRCMQEDSTFHNHRYERLQFQPIISLFAEDPKIATSGT
jgi:hypothetical protein